MTISKYKQPFFIAHLVGLVVTLFLTFGLTFVYMFGELAPYKGIAMAIFSLGFALTNLMAALALRRIGQSPRFALSGFLMGLIPLILYIVLPDKNSPSA
ncbi:hypothetical protein [Geothrix alkalitolerans]|uniref:hypothetical protein n=1 Tax=Geothrix alkalitolerans TaxID=2922724 RepID=UPI001FAF21C8|nr:hypothetical protein [Geothrix alkalitolerans]